jgi:hypothetical protein
MRSSKWLVFIRSRLAGFDRSLTFNAIHRALENAAVRDFPIEMLEIKN